ncbi:MAG: ThiF family adenylyltransferase [Planctomycetes bacterium]|nr:ThiF family adenylyltransferase [Planctomycetota bacterium]
MLLPEDGDRLVHGNASFTGQYFARAMKSALRHGGGIALLHSHPLGVAWQGLSDDDRAAEAGHAGAAIGATGLPLLGLTLAVQSGRWSARFWRRTAPRTYEPDYCDSVRVVGIALDPSFAPAMPPPRSKPELTRTVSVWGDEKQADLARLHVGVVGAGSVGALVAESLARMGVARVSLIDADTVKRHNLDRLLHSSVAKIGMAKVDVLAATLPASATADGFEVIPAKAWITDEDGYRAALDCDVLFSCVDRPWGKRVLNHIAYAHLIPVVDGGLAIYAPQWKLKHADWSVRTVAPGRACLECVKAYDPGLVAAEMEGHLDDPRYIEGLPDDHVLKRNENVFPFSMSVAAHEVLQFVALVTGMKRMHEVGEQRYHYYPGTMDVNTTLKCAPGCPHAAAVATADKKYRIYRTPSPSS